MNGPQVFPPSVERRSQRPSHLVRSASLSFADSFFHRFGLYDLCYLGHNLFFYNSFESFYVFIFR